jgi:hypothetical protein
MPNVRRLCPLTFVIAVAWYYVFPAGTMHPVKPVQSQWFRTREDCERDLKRALWQLGKHIESVPQCTSTSVPDTALPAAPAPMTIVGWELVVPPATPTGKGIVEGRYPSRAECDSARQRAVQNYSASTLPEFLPSCIAEQAPTASQRP